MKNEPKVKIILVSFNRPELTIACLYSLSKINYSNYSIVIIDNASQDGAPKAIQHAFPKVRIIELSKNLGFVGGNNLGLEAAVEDQSDYALLLNNDTEVAPDFLRILVDAAESEDQIGVVGPMIYYFDDPKRIWSAGGAIEWSKGTTRMVGLDELDQGQFGNAPVKANFVTGCALLVKMRVVSAVGRLDERFFLYYEETEWCTRIAQAGYSVVFVPAAKIWHKISTTQRAVSPMVHYYMTRNRLLFLRLSKSGWQAWANVLLKEYLRTLLSWSLRPKWRDRGALRQAMWRGIRDFFAGRFGQMTQESGNALTV